MPFGNVTVLQYINATGPSEAPVTTWFAKRGDGGTVLLAAWDDREEMQDTKRGGEVFIGYQPSDKTVQYRIEVAPVGAPTGGPVLRSELQVASANGLVGLRTHWAPVVGLLAGSAGLEVRALSAEGTLVRVDRVGAAEFGRSLRIAGGIQPEFEAMIANYRERCRPSDHNGH